MSATPAQFTGYGAQNEAAGKAFELTKIPYTPKVWSEDDVDIKIECCGVCGSDLHVLTNGWPSPTHYDAIVGHEIVGTIVRAGKNTTHKVGTRVGVGAQAGSCLSCDYCDEKKEQFCEKGMIGTYQGTWEDGSISMGGYADYTRVKGRFAIPVPEGLPSEVAAPLYCAGITVFSPLKRFHAGPGKKVGVVGIGGLGHLALQFSTALGAETYALSHSARKAEDAEKLGVKPENFLITSDIKVRVDPLLPVLNFTHHFVVHLQATVKKHARSLDIIICTSFQTDLPIEALFFKLLKPEGTLVLCGLPEEKLPAMFGHALVGKAISLAGSIIGGTDEIKEMLDLALAKNVRPWVTVRPMADASQVVKDMDAGKAHYRYVLENPK